MSNESGQPPQITLRIPGDWSHPRQLVERLPDGYQLGPEGMVLPDGTRLEFNPLPPDQQFPTIFRSACRRPAHREEEEIVSRYTVNIGLAGPGGSMDLALKMMQAAAAILRTGAAGVFIDNSALAHGASDWLMMTEDGGADAVSFAFTSIIRAKQAVYTMGMHTMGYPELLMSCSDVVDDEEIVELIRYVCADNRPIDVGHILADEEGPRFQVVARTSDEFEPGSSMHNPYGVLKIMSIKDIADGN